MMSICELFQIPEKSDPSSAEPVLFTFHSERVGGFGYQIGTQLRNIITRRLCPVGFTFLYFFFQLITITRQQLLINSHIIRLSGCRVSVRHVSN